MDHPCYKCGHSVEDGRPFCSQCGAPQIRVAMPEGVTPAAAESVLSSPLPIFASESVSVDSIMLSPGIVWPRALRACLVAALVAILVTSLRLVAPLLAVFCTGSFAVVFYRTRNPSWRANASSGAQLGAISGLLFSAILAIFATLIVVILQAGGDVRQQMIEALQQVASRSTDPQIQSALDVLKRPEGLGAKLTQGVAILSVLSIALGSLAGALTGLFLGRRNRL